jgi:hypothetical protein
MLSLHEMQDGIRRAVLADEATATDWIVADGLDAADRLRIHHNNTFITLIDALSTVFPVIQRLVGEDFFAFAARAFIRSEPPESGSLIEFGRTFADFLEAFEPAVELVYLADVARLEWAWHEAYHSVEAEPLAPRALGHIPAHLRGDLRLHLHPSSRFVTSPYPIHRIWEINQPGCNSSETVDLEDGGTRLLVIRPAAHVEVRIVPVAIFAFLRALADFQPVAVAAEAARREDPTFDTTATLERLLAGETFSNFSLAKEEKRS